MMVLDSIPRSIKILLLLIATSAVSVLCNVEPALPQVQYDASYDAPTTNKISVAAGESIQQAIDDAEFGTVIELEAGAYWNLSSFESFQLKEKQGSGWIYIQSSAYNMLPPPGTRITPEYSQYMPKIVTNRSAAFGADKRAHHYRIVGVEVIMSPVPTIAFMDFGMYEEGVTMDELADHIVLDRVYLHADSEEFEARRGVAMNMKSGAVVDSRIVGFKSEGGDAQGICGWFGPGPYLIENNYIEGAGENIMFGGADPPLSLNSPVPADITIRHNHHFKPLAWKETTRWVVKNLFELKCGERVLFEGNVLHNSFADDQTGYAILLTPRGQAGPYPYARVVDITIRNNIIHNMCSGVSMLNYDNYGYSLNLTNVLIHNNFFYNLTTRYCNGGASRAFQLIQGGGLARNIQISHNSIVPEFNSILGTMALLGDSPIIADNFVMKDNIIWAGEYGFQTSEGSGIGGLNLIATNSDLYGNIVVGEVYNSATVLPNDTVVAVNAFISEFENYAAGDMRLSQSSTYRNTASDGTDPGANFVDIICAIHPNDKISELASVTCPTIPTAPTSTPSTTSTPSSPSSPTGSNTPVKGPISPTSSSSVLASSLVTIVVAIALVA